MTNTQLDQNKEIWDYLHDNEYLHQEALDAARDKNCGEELYNLLHEAYENEYDQQVGYRHPQVWSQYCEDRHRYAQEKLEGVPLKLLAVALIAEAESAY